MAENVVMTAHGSVPRSHTSDSIWERRVPGGLRGSLDLVGLALLGLFFFGFVARNLTHQGDLKTYQLAAQAVLAGQDPYVPENLSALAGRRVSPFVYPPIALLPFVTVAAMPSKVVASIWIWGKISMLGFLVFLWGRWFLRRVPLLVLGLVAAFGWNSSALWDLAAGNVAILEAGLIWAALTCFVSGRRTLFVCLVLASASFKLTPVALLLLLLVPIRGAAPSPRLLIVASVAFAVLVLGPLVVGPAAGFRTFWSHVPDATGYGDSNPSALGLVSVLLQRIGVQGAGTERIAIALWFACVCGLFIASRSVLQTAYQTADPRRWAMIAVFLYVLALPRPMAYGYFLLTPAPFFFSPRPFARGPGPLLLALVLSAQGLLRLTQMRWELPLVTYAPYLLTLCVWLLIVNAHMQQQRSDAGPVEGPATTHDPACGARAA